MTSPARLTGSEVARYLKEACPGELCDLVLELRELVLTAAPEAAEAIKFNALCYFKPNQPYGTIGGNICMISARDDFAQLGFIHGASLPDPDHLLEGTAKAKRYIDLRSSKDLRRGPIRKLIRAAVAHQPG
jgi:hypothetical protein